MIAAFSVVIQMKGNNMKTKVKAVTVKNSKEVPEQLMVKDGKLLCKDGSEPDFSNFPDGDVSLIMTERFKRDLDDVWMLNHWGA